MRDDARTSVGAASDEAANPSGPSEILAPGLSVVFCGLNPALSAARDGHNFSNRSNRFWRVLHLAGFTPRQLEAEEEREILAYGLGLTSAVARPTKSASELKRHDYLTAAPVLESNIRHFAPANLAFLGKAAYAAIGLNAHIEWGKQADDFAGASVWVLPNPSGLNRAFNLERLTRHYRELHLTLELKREATALSMGVEKPKTRVARRGV
ncbi:G/U mismatch-specific DNA glycosylase [Neorhizobium lilium]|uniref:G/U mismatch-specific DNA glycosylase n=1 Tax=Neorhizobium lilium TaxID=2503024 RepID=A0A444LL07_9HYPH|nr:G/U mismatch-specific DNA glycosylase [Neorhizobium lilium]RWX80982.1 G/U mismatch-specific DNA glycosylase [Neorhizobium lilium]